MSVTNAHRPSLIPMEPLRGDAVKRMSIGTLDEQGAVRRRQRFRVAAGACAAFFIVTLALRVASSRARAPTTDEWAPAWDLAAELRLPPPNRLLVRVVPEGGGGGGGGGKLRRVPLRFAPLRISRLARLAAAPAEAIRPCLDRGGSLPQ